MERCSSGKEQALWSSALTGGECLGLGHSTRKSSWLGAILERGSRSSELKVAAASISQLPMGLRTRKGMLMPASELSLVLCRMDSLTMIIHQLTKEPLLSCWERQAQNRTLSPHVAYQQQQRQTRRCTFVSLTLVCFLLLCCGGDFFVFIAWFCLFLHHGLILSFYKCECGF